MSYEQDQQQYNNYDKEDSREVEAMRKMFVGGLSRDTTEDTFFEYFGQFGTMVDKVIITDNATKQSRGFGFITYAESNSVEKVFSSRPHIIDGKQLDVKRAMPREFNTPGAHTKTKKLFIGGFKGLAGFTPEDLQTYIESRHDSSFGVIESIDFLKDKEKNENKGFGFIMCSSTDFADRLAISETSFTLKGRQMSIKKAEPKEGAGGQGAGGPARGPAPRGGRGGTGGRGGGRGGGAGRGGRGAGRGGGFGGNNYDQSAYGNNAYQTQYPQYQNYPQTQDNSGYGNYGNQYAAGGYGGYGNQQYPDYSQQQQFNQAPRGGAAGRGNNRYQPY